MKYRRQPFFFIALTTAGASSVSLIGGIGLEAVTARLLPLVPLIVAMPALNTMVGDYAAIIAAHAGDPNERPRTKRALAHAIGKVMCVNVVGVLLLSILLALRRGYAFEPTFLARFIVFVPVSMFSIIGLMFVLTTFLDKLTERSRLNPDDILIPIVTSITDVCMLGLIAIAAVFIF